MGRGVCHKSQWKQSKGTHRVSLFIDRSTVGCFDSFRIECIPQDVLNKIKYKSITHNIQADDSIIL